MAPTQPRSSQKPPPNRRVTSVDGTGEGPVGTLAPTLSENRLSLIVLNTLEGPTSWDEPKVLVTVGCAGAGTPGRADKDRAQQRVTRATLDLMRKWFKGVEIPRNQICLRLETNLYL